MEIDKYQTIRRLETLKSDLQDMLNGHYSIRAEDDQYDDPAMWWAEPALMQINQLIAFLDTW